MEYMRKTTQTDTGIETMSSDEILVVSGGDGSSSSPDDIAAAVAALTTPYPTSFNIHNIPLVANAKAKLLAEGLSITTA